MAEQTVKAAIAKELSEALQEAWIDAAGDEYCEGWLECEADHPDAVPFWKDAI